MKLEEMTDEQLRDFIKEAATVYIENVNIIATSAIEMPDVIKLTDYSRN